jgi:hypothetical protein
MKLFAGLIITDVITELQIAPTPIFLLTKTDFTVKRSASI